MKKSAFAIVLVVIATVLVGCSDFAHKHAWRETKYTAATCTQDGERISVCIGCGEEKVEVLKALGHMVPEWTLNEEESVVEGICSTCKEVDKKEVLLASTADSLNAAISDASKPIYILSDITLTETIEIKDGKTVEINLNGKSITKDSRPFKIGNAKVVFSGEGTIAETKSDQYAPLQVYGSDVDTENYTVVTVGKGITLKGWSGIFVALNAEGTYNHYGLVVNVDGNIVAPAAESHVNGSGIYINGQCQVVEGNVPVFNLEGASIVARETGIYAAGYAIWNIKDATIESANALSLKSGSFTIDGGLYRSTGEFFEPSEDTSNGSVDTGAALSMTSNDGYAKKLDVVVNSGRFESVNGYAVYEGIPNKKNSSTPVAAESYVTLVINGGEFIGNTDKGSIKLNSIKNPKVIYGGSFNVTPDSSYFAE